MSRELLQQALDALEFPHDSEWSNKAKAIEALRQALAQPEFDTPESHIVKWSIPVDPNNFGEPLAQPEQDWDLLAATQASLREHQARIKELEAQLAQPEQEELIQFKDGKWSYVRKPWVGLTDDEIKKIVDLNTSDDGGFDIWCDGIAVAHIVCAKLKEKNA